MKQSKKEPSSILEKIDFFGANFVLSFDSKREFTSNLGGFFTIITTSAIIYTIYTFGQEFYLKNNPYIINRLIGNKNRTNMTLDLNLAFTIEDIYGGLVTNYSRFVQFTPYLTNITWWDADNYNITISNLTMTPCNITEFDPSQWGDFIFDNLKFALCLDKTQKIGGFQDIMYNVFLTVDMSRCKNITVNSPCASDQEIDTFLANHSNQMTVYFEQLVMNPQNYTNPVSKYISEDFYRINSLFCQINQFFVQFYNISTDDGWMLQNTNITTNKRVDKIKNYFDFTNNIYSDCIVKTQFYTSDYDRIDYRSYVKLPSVLAQLGGLLKVIFGFFDVFLMYVYRRKMNEKVISSLYKISNHDLEKSDIKENKMARIKMLQMKNKEKLEKSKSKIDPSVEIKPNDEKSKDAMIKNDIEEGAEKVEVQEEENKDDEYVISSEIKIPKDHEAYLTKAITNYYKENSKLEMVKSIEDVETEFNITMLEHFISMICPFIAGNLLRKKQDIYNILSEYIVEYTDVLSFAKAKTEIEKLKYVLMNPKQMAMFNLIPPPENPIKTQKIMNRVSILYKYSKDYKAQIRQAKRYLEELQSSKKKTLLDVKILELLG